VIGNANPASALRDDNKERLNMKLRIAASVVFLLIAATTFAADVAATPSDAQKSFDQLKALAGSWQGPVVMPKDSGIPEGTIVKVSMRITSRGNALVHEMYDWMKADDPAKNDHPVTMFYLDNGRLLLTHYCDAGNRPRMVARTSPDGKTLEFDFLDVAGSTQYGHMQHAVFTIIDADHHSEEWTFLMPGDKLMRGHMDLQRIK
jgi:hypothetical protein